MRKGVVRRVILALLSAILLIAICLWFLSGTAEGGLSSLSIQFVGSITNGRGYTELICVVSNGSPHRLQVHTAIERKGPSGWLQSYESVSTAGDIPAIPSVATQAMITNRVELPDGNFTFRCVALCWKNASIQTVGDVLDVIKVFIARKSISVECFTPELGRDAIDGVIRAVIPPQEDKD